MDATQCGGVLQHGQATVELAKLMLVAYESPLVLNRVRNIPGCPEGTWLCMHEVHSKLLGPLKKTTFIQHLKKVPARQREATADQKRQLWINGAIKTMAKSVKLVELSGLCNGIFTLTQDRSLVKAIREFGSAPALQQDISQGLPEASVSERTIQPAQPLPHLPNQLPRNIVPEAELREPYSLGEADREHPEFRAEMDRLVSYLSEGLQADRDGGALAERTIENLSNQVYMYLGFGYLYCNQDSPQLKLFLSKQVLGLYISFQLKKKNSWNTINSFFAAAKRVLDYLGREDKAWTNQVKLWLKRLAGQLRRMLLTRKADPGLLEAQGKWISAAALVQLIERYRSSVMRSLPAPGQAWSSKVARAVHDLILVSCMFSHLPPVRLHFLRLLQTPATAKCLWSGCFRKKANVDCESNRLVAKQNGDLHLIMSHFTVESRMEGAAVTVNLPSDLRDLVKQFLMHGHPVLSPAGYAYVFSDSQGRHLATSVSMSHYWPKVLRQIECPIMFPPHRLRDIFITERKSLLPVRGPKISQAAMLMGNTEAARDRHYDAHYQMREAQTGVDAMTVWRQEMLHKDAAPVRPPIQDADASISDLIDSELDSDLEEDAVLVPLPSDDSDGMQSELASEATTDNETDMSDCYSESE